MQGVATLVSRGQGELQGNGVLQGQLLLQGQGLMKGHVVLNGAGEGWGVQGNGL